MNRWMNMQEICEYLKISPATVYRWREKGIIQALSIQGITRYDREEVDKLFLEQKKKESRSP